MAVLRSFLIRLAALALFAFAVPVTPCFAQASGHVRVKIVKAGLGAPFIDDLGYLHRSYGVTALGRKSGHRRP
jgi:hypothetical protein